MALVLGLNLGIQRFNFLIALVDFIILEPYGAFVTVDKIYEL